MTYDLSLPDWVLIQGDWRWIGVGTPPTLPEQKAPGTERTHDMGAPAHAAEVTAGTPSEATPPLETSDAQGSETPETEAPAEATEDTEGETASAE